MTIDINYPLFQLGTAMLQGEQESCYELWWHIVDLSIKKNSAAAAEILEPVLDPLAESISLCRRLIENRERIRAAVLRALNASAWQRAGLRGRIQ